MRDLADAVCSTEKMITYCRESPAKQFVIVTESGIIHRMQQACPDKEFLCAPVFDALKLAHGQLPVQRMQVHENETRSKNSRDCMEAPLPARGIEPRHHPPRPPPHRAHAGNFRAAR